MNVLDASALQTLLNHEGGWDVIARRVTHEAATISGINYAEVLRKAVRLDVAVERVDAEMEAMGITVTPVGRLDGASLLPPSLGAEPRRPGLGRAGQEAVQHRLHGRSHLAGLASEFDVQVVVIRCLPLGSGPAVRSRPRRRGSEGAFRARQSVSLTTV